MAFKQKPRHRLNLRGRLVLAAAVTTFVGLIVFSCFFVYLNTGIKKAAKATTSESLNLIDFQANQNSHNSVKLEWETGNEANIQFFTLERSIDGYAFSTIRKIHSQGNSSATKLYTHIDTNPLKGISYYRLSQTDSSGSLKVLQTAQVTFKSHGQNATARMTAGPNPFRDHITLYTTADQQGPITARIYSVSGTLVNEIKQNNSSASEAILINGLENLPKGTYLLKTYSGGLAGESIVIAKE